MSSKLSRMCTGGGKKRTSCANFLRTPLMRASSSPPPEATRALSTSAMSRKPTSRPSVSTGVRSSQVASGLACAASAGRGGGRQRGDLRHERVAHREQDEAVGGLRGRQVVLRHADHEAADEVDGENEFRWASIAICLPGMASSVKRAPTSAMRSAPFVTTMKLMTTRIANTINPTAICRRSGSGRTIRSPPPPRRRRCGPRAARRGWRPR